MCEQFNREKQKWNPFPDLLQPRSLHGACSFSDIFIYVLCGTGKSYMSSVDRYCSERRCWQKVEVLNGEKSWKQTWGIGAVQISGSDIIIFGSGDDGYRNVHKVIVGEKQLISSSKIKKEQFASMLVIDEWKINQIKKSPSISCYGRGFGVFGDNVFAVDNGYKLWMVDSQLKYEQCYQQYKK